MKRIVILLFCTLSCTVLSAQPDDCHLRISLLTCGPGEDLYSVFGHTAVRVTDSTAHTDIIYNYGTFDFSDPDFYIKFVKGKLLYFVSVERYTDFIYEYHLDNRSITEQLLDLTCADKQVLSAALKNNAREENKYYFYQFLFDNCSTRVRDIVQQHTGEALTFKNILPTPPQTFRKMIHVCLDNDKQYWSELGIDLALGSLIDRPPTNEEAMFLPDYLLKGFDSARLGGSPLVSSKRPILAAVPVALGTAVFSPINTTVTLLTFVLILMLTNRRWAHRFLDVFDVALFFIVGGIGCFLLFMWFGTEHDLTANNYNLLWALPTHLPLSVLILRKKEWVRKYFVFCSVFYLLLAVGWMLVPQGMNAAFWPFTVLLGLRCFVRSRKNDGHDRKNG